MSKIETRPNLSSDQPPEQSESSRFPLKWRIVAGLAGVAITAGVSVGVSNSQHSISEKSPTTSSAPENTPTPTPVHTETAPSTPNIEQLIAANEINANQDPTALSEDILAKFSAWYMYGSDTVAEKFNAVVRKTGDSSDEAMSQFVSTYVDEGESIFAPALFGADYKSNISIQDTLTIQREVNKVALIDAIITQNDSVPYKRGASLLALVDSTPTSLAINYTQNDNAGTGENKIPATNSINGINGRLTVVFKVENGKVILTTAQY